MIIEKEKKRKSTTYDGDDELTNTHAGSTDDEGRRKAYAGVGKLL
jgi:hypothetical protein